MLHSLLFSTSAGTTTKYTTRLLQNVPHDYSTMLVAFDRTVDVTHSTFSINEQTLLTRLGGSVSSGRTLLWILVSLLGATKVVNYLMPYMTIMLSFFDVLIHLLKKNGRWKMEMAQFGEINRNIMDYFENT